VTQAQCEALYTGCSDEYGDAAEVTTASLGTFWYKLWCPCGGAEGYYSATNPGGSPYGGSSTSLTGAGVGMIVALCVVGCCCLGCGYRYCGMGEKGGGYAGRYGSEPRGVEMRGGRTLANEPKRGSY
jgi:hypothetical protein